MQEKFKGSVKSLVYKGDNGYVVLRVQPDKRSKYLKDEIMVTGYCPDLDAVSQDKAKGLLCNIEGKVVRHPKYGIQIEASLIEVDMTGLAFFLAHIVKGLGKKLTDRLIEKYGTNLENILDNNPEVLLEEKGIKEKKLQKIIKSWNEFKQLRGIYSFFADHHVPLGQKQILNVYKTFQEQYKDIPAVIRENPFILTEVDGIGFKTAFKVAQCFDYDINSIDTIKAALDYILIKEAKENGHTYLTIQNIIDKISEEIPEIDKNIYATTILEQLLKNTDDVDNPYVMHVVRNQYDQDEIIVGLKKLYYQEAWLYDNIKKRLSTVNPFIISEEELKQFIQRKEQELGITLGEKQYEAIKAVATQGHNFFILCGYAGTGKSTISKIIIDFYKEHFFKDHEIISCAFTGMASKRIKETTQHDALTIHSLLKIGPEGSEYNSKNPLPYKLILIDEASMINLWLFYKLLQAIKQDSIIVVVGDDAQLPPIGEGNVFADLLSKDWIPKVKLDKIYRQSSDSVLTYFASFIRQGRVPDELNLHKENRYKDFIFIPRNIYAPQNSSELEKERVRQETYNIIQKDILNTIKQIVNTHQLSRKDAIWNIQVITAMKKGELGTQTLNQLVQEYLNGQDNTIKKVTIKHSTLGQDDKVIHLKNKNMIAMPYNQYATLRNANTRLDLEEIMANGKEDRIYNGNIGMVLDIDDDNAVFTVLYPDGMRNKVVFYTFDDFKDIIDLGYALTIHKTQGNQFKFVIIPLTNSHYVMLNNKLMYTAITRAKEQAYLIGQSYAFKLACTNIDRTIRNTFISLDGNRGFTLTLPNRPEQKRIFTMIENDRSLELG